MHWCRRETVYEMHGINYRLYMIVWQISLHYSHYSRL